MDKATVCLLQFHDNVRKTLAVSQNWRRSHQRATLHPHISNCIIYAHRFVQVSRWLKLLNSSSRLVYVSNNCASFCNNKNVGEELSASQRDNKLACMLQTFSESRVALYHSISFRLHRRMFACWCHVAYVYCTRCSFHTQCSRKSRCLNILSIAHPSCSQKLFDPLMWIQMFP